jgi:Calx-beta domain
MPLVPATKPRSVWRTLVLLFAALLTFGLLTPVTASAHSPTLLGVRDTAVQELDYGYRYVHVKVALNHRVDHKVSVGWYTKAINATPWVDYRPAAGRAFIPKWHKFTYVHVKVYGDTKVEPNEYFKVVLVHPRGARIADRVGIVKIWNDDYLPKLYVKKAVVREGGLAVFPVELSKPAPETVTFSFVTKDGYKPLGPLDPAEVDKDYDKTYGHGTIDKGKTSTTVEVKTRLDSDTTEGPEYFLLKLFHIDGADEGDSHTLGIILDGPDPKATP